MMLMVVINMVQTCIFKSIFWNIRQAILGLILFYHLWTRYDTSIIPLLDIYILSLFFYLLFIYPKMTLQEYLYAAFCLISSTILILPTKWSTCYISFLMLIVSVGIPYTPSISAAVIMYASVSMISLVGLPIF